MLAEVAHRAPPEQVPIRRVVSSWRSAPLSVDLCYRPPVASRFECPRCQNVFVPDGHGADDAFVECPACGALAMSAGEATDALARAVTGAHDIPTNLQPSGEATLPPSQEAAGFPEPPSTEAVASPGIFSNLLDSKDVLALPSLPSEPPSPPPPVAEPPSSSSSSSSQQAAGRAEAGLDLGLADELGDFVLPTTAPAQALSPSKKTPAKKAPSTPSTSTSAPSPAAPKVGAVANDAVDFSGEGAAALTEEAFGALEAAFDGLAAKPAARGKDGLTDDERAFLGDSPAARAAPPSKPSKPSKSAAPPPPKPSKAAALPPPRRPKRDRGAGFALSPEAREAAFLAVRSDAPRPARALPAEMDSATIEAPTSALAEATVPQQQAPPRPGQQRAQPAEPTDIVAANRKKPAPARPRPSVLGGVPAIALSVAVFAGLAGGAAVGALTTPQQVKRNDARARAEEQLAEGNRFYEAQRYDDALGKYKGAVSIDRAFAIAHRAKGAALAKQNRHDEAADAYLEYLNLEPSAVDAADVKAAVAARGKGAASTAGGGG